MSSYIAGTVLLLLVIYPTFCFALACGKLPIFSWNVIVPAEFSKAFGLPFQLTFPCDITRCNLDKNMKQSFGNAITGTADPSQEQGEIDNLIIDMFNKAGEGLDFNDSLQSLESALEGKDAATIETLVVNALEASIQSEMQKAFQSEIQSGMHEAIKQELKFKDKLFEYATYPSIGLYGLALLLLLISFVYRKTPYWLTLWRSTKFFTVLAVISNLAFCSMMGLYIIGARDELKKKIGEERLKMFKLKVSPLFVNLCIAPALLLSFAIACLCFKIPIRIQPEKSQVQPAAAADFKQDKTPDANPAEATKTTPLLSDYVTETSE